MKKLNLDIVIKIIILLRFSVFYFRIIRNNEIMIYVNPRIVPFVVFGMIAMFIIALFLVKDIFNNKKKKLKIKNYVIFIIPLIMIFFMENNRANSTTIKSSDINTNSNITSNSDLNTINQNNDLNNVTSNVSSAFELYGGKTESNGQGTIDKKELDIKDDVINVNAKNFVFSLDEILNNPDKYVGKKIEITGFVYKGQSIKGNEFIIGRFMMICCVADMQIAGIRCEGNNLESYDNDTWIKIKGQIKNDIYEGAVDPIIVVEHIEKDTNPDNSYVYPF